MIAQAVRYGGVGVIVYAIDLAIYALCVALAPASYLAANIAGRAAGAFAGFFLHKHVTFAGEQRHATARQALAYLTLLATNMAASSGLLWLLVGMGFPATPARIAIDVVVIATSFIVSRLLVFRVA